jgi:hypothetical protein
MIRKSAFQVQVWVTEANHGLTLAAAGAGRLMRLAAPQVQAVTAWPSTQIPEIFVWALSDDCRGVASGLRCQ